MKLRINDEEDKACEVWLVKEGKDILLKWIDEDGEELYIVKLSPNKTIYLCADSGFKMEQ